MTAIAFDPGPETVGLAFDLPDGWICLDLQAPELPARVDRLLHVVLEGIVSNTPAAQQCVRDLVARLVADGADCLLMCPAVDGMDVAITGGVFVCAPLRVSGTDLYRTLDDRGDAVALGEIDGLPIVSLVRPSAASAPGQISSVQVVYLICGGGATVVLSFAAADHFDPRRVVDEVARLVSGARVVR